MDGHHKLKEHTNVLLIDELTQRPFFFPVYGIFQEHTTRQIRKQLLAFLLLQQ